MKKGLYFLILFVLIQSCKKALVLDIRSISFNDNTTVFLGQKQDVMVKNLPDSIFSITYNKEQANFILTLKQPIYFQIDGITQNSVFQNSIESIEIDGNHYKFNKLLEIKNKYTANDSKVKYIQLKHLIKLAYNHSNINNLNTILSFDKDDNKSKLTILDTNIIVTQKNGSKVKFVSTDIIQSDAFSLEFFKTLHSSILNNTQKYFHINDTIYYSSVKPYFSFFGASKFNIYHINESINISFNNIFRSVIPLKAIKAIIDSNENIPVDLKQNFQANTYSNQIYANNISNNNLFSFGTIDKNLKFEKNELNGILNSNDYLIYKINYNTFIVPFLFLFSVFILCLIIISKFKWEFIFEFHKNNENNIWKQHFYFIFICLFLLLTSRLFIGYNLSYTSPFYYFAFLTAIITAPLILIAVLLIWIVISPLQFSIENFKEKKYSFLLHPLAILIFTILVLIVQYLVVNYLSKFFIEELFDKYNIDNIFNSNSPSYIKIIFFLCIYIIILNIFYIIAFYYSKFNSKKIEILTFVLTVISLPFVIIGNNSYSVLNLMIIIFLFLFLIYFSRNKNNIYLKYILILIFLCGIIFPFYKGDLGYVINLILGFIIFICFIIFNNSKTKISYFIRILIVLFLIGVIWIMYWLNANSEFNPINNNRFTNRLIVYQNFNTVHEYGTRQTEEHAQFFAILGKYAFPTEYNLYEPIHPGISISSDPIVKNDLSAPFGLINPFGPNFWWVPVSILIIIWFTMIYMVCNTVMVKENLGNNNEGFLFSYYGIIRLFCASMIVGSGIWLIGSYYNIVPFTGRLIFGMGQDSIAEVFETIFLFGYMGLVGKSNSNNK
ncbi:MAG: hypothetical protein QM539_04480 [Alphaproteobacteria bacterium]|nr:hypothetical protein [Alphaproteobacteria bacterium]